MLDLLVVGSGVAGLSAAVRAAERGLSVGIVTKGVLEQATTRWAQGGVAAVLGGDPDSADLHLADTLAAGAGLCDVEAVRVLVDEGPARVHELIALGAVFDRDHRGELLLAREGGHSVPRIVHAGGAATGAEVERALVAATLASARDIREHHFALGVVLDAGGSCAALTALDANGSPVTVEAANVLLATGGAGQVYAVTTNPAEATADGMAMAMRSGAVLADMEFVQFHPTALHHPVMPRPLLSEALRGHGAVLRDLDGERFVDELQPRDVVARAIAEEIADGDVDHVWLDCTGVDRFGERFPTIAASMSAAGFDPQREWLPVAPAAHYLCGGVLTDLDGATTVPGLWAAGETACTGVHGANRLASNSLLEGMVFAARVVEAVADGRRGPRPTGVMGSVMEPGPAAVPVTDVALPSREPWSPPRSLPAIDAARQARAALQQTMTDHAGVVRSARSLERAATSLATLGAPPELCGRAEVELANLADVAAAIVASATARRETRGGHTRLDFNERDDATGRCHHLVRRPAIDRQPSQDGS
ncbi:MAG TPA: FAD-dependent oxidoreductase [Acidimicrobiales bacterium]